MGDHQADRARLRHHQERARGRGDLPHRPRRGGDGRAQERGRRRERRQLAEGRSRSDARRGVAMSVLIKGGRVVTAVDDYVADVYVEDETVSLIGESLDVQADRVIDASGKYVLPGGVDPHTHLDMPFGGTITIDDFESGQTRSEERRVGKECRSRWS